MDYKKEIIRLLEDVESEKFLKQIYTIIVRHVRKAKS